MDMQSFLDDLIKTGREYAEKGQKMAEEKLDIGEEGDKRDATLDGMKKGALAAGALVLLLGTGAGRKLTGTALKIGSLAAVGGIAYKTWQNWQEEQTKAAKDAKTHKEEKQSEILAKIEPPKALSVDRLEGEAAEERSQILVKAMIAAAKSDGKMNKEETAGINQQIKKLGLGTDIEDVLKAGMVTPLSAKSVAKMADDKEIAAEIYIVSMLVTDTENNQEKSYMNSLAEALELPKKVVENLEKYRQ
ncbi:MAG: tellurite resistance TerB family protein [Thiotrichaceae bacterium]